MTEPAPAADPDLPRCQCGHTRDHHMVSSECSYSFWGYFALFTGITVYPTKVVFRCRDCQERFEETSDRELCRRYR